MGHRGGGNHAQQLHVCAHAAQAGSQRALQHIAGDAGVLADENAGLAAGVLGENGSRTSADLHGQLTAQVFPGHAAHAVGTKQFAHKKFLPSFELSELYRLLSAASAEAVSMKSIFKMSGSVFRPGFHTAFKLYAHSSHISRDKL